MYRKVQLNQVGLPKPSPASLLPLMASSGPFFPPLPKYKGSSLSTVHRLVICFPSLGLGVFPQQIYKTD